MWGVVDYACYITITKQQLHNFDSDCLSSMVGLLLRFCFVSISLRSTDVATNAIPDPGSIVLTPIRHIKAGRSARL